MTWRQVVDSTVSALLPKDAVASPPSDSTGAYGPANAMQLLRDIANGVHKKDEATVFEVDAAGERCSCIDVKVLKTDGRHVEVEIEGDQPTSPVRLPRQGWTVMAACTGYNSAKVRDAAKH